MYKVKLYLKGGSVIEFYCDEYEFTYDNKTLDYIGYKIKGQKDENKNPMSFGLVPSEISAYTIIEA